MTGPRARAVSGPPGLLLLAGCFAAAATMPIATRTFSHGTSLWSVSPGGLVSYDTETRAARRVILDQTSGADSIVDVAESDGVLWVVTVSGLFQADMATATVERVVQPFAVNRDARIAVDFDYVWVSGGDTLWQYDRLGFEWFGFPLETVPGSTGAVRAMHSTGDEVLCVCDAGVSVFAVSDERWRHHRMSEGAIGADAVFRPDERSLVLTSGKTLHRYLIDSYSWEVVDIGEEAADIEVADSAYYLATASRVLAFDKATSVLRPIAVAGIIGPRALAVQDSFLFVSTEKTLTKYDRVNEIAEEAKLPAALGRAGAASLAGAGGIVVAFGAGAVGSYSVADDVWELTELAGGTGGGRRFTWDDQGLGWRYGPGARSIVRGKTGITDLRTRTEWVYTDSLSTVVYDSAGQASGVATVPDTAGADQLFLYYNEPRVPIDLTLHNELPGGRYLDLFFDNSAKGQMPEKGVYYRGADEDNVQSVRFGTTEFRPAQSRTLPEVGLEGGDAFVASRRKLVGRDRRIVRTQSGGGYVVTETRYRVLEYDAGGIYDLGIIPKQSGGKPAELDDIRIVPGSVKLWIDGERVEPAEFVVYYAIGELGLSRPYLADPTSVITVSFQVRAVSEGGVDSVELVPSSHRGTIGYTFVSVAPAEWLAPSAGYVYRQADSALHVVNVSTPLELRGGGFLLKLNPEASVNAVSGSPAGAVSLQSRLGDRLSASIDGLVVDTGFRSTEALTRGYGATRREAGFDVTYDLREEIPVRYYQHNRRATAGAEDRFELSGGVRYEGFPFGEFSASRNRVDAVFVDTLTMPADTDTVLMAVTPERDSVTVDTILGTKDKIELRIWETSSHWARKLLGIQKMTYDVSWSLFGPRMFGEGIGEGGYLFHGRANLTPFSTLVLGGSGLYIRGNGPSPSRRAEPEVFLQTYGLPSGVDLSGRHRWNLSRHFLADSSFVDLYRQVRIALKPGQWWDALGWLSTWAELSHSRTCLFRTSDPAATDALFGRGAVAGEVISPRAAVTIAPGSVLVGQSVNAWARVAGSPDTLTYTSLNDIAVRLRDGDTWETTWQYTRRSTGYRNHRGSSSYTRKWLPWMTTEQGVKGAYTAADTARFGETGPVARVEVGIGEALFLRSLTNTHDVAVLWGVTDGAVGTRPRVMYDLYLNALLKPNFSVRVLASMAWREGRLEEHGGSLSAFALF